jgi:hypothetical protein
MGADLLNDYSLKLTFKSGFGSVTTSESIEIKQSEPFCFHCPSLLKVSNWWSWWRSMMSIMTVLWRTASLENVHLATSSEKWSSVILARLTLDFHLSNAFDTNST